jgi:hypothetical protein
MLSSPGDRHATETLHQTHATAVGERAAEPLSRVPRARLDRYPAETRALIVELRTATGWTTDQLLAEALTLFRAKLDRTRRKQQSGRKPEKKARTAERSGSGKAQPGPAAQPQPIETSPGDASSKTTNETTPAQLRGPCLRQAVRPAFFVFRTGTARPARGGQTETTTRRGNARWRMTSPRQRNLLASRRS